MNNIKDFTNFHDIFDNLSPPLTKKRLYKLHLDHLQHHSYDQEHQCVCLCLSSMLMTLYSPNKLLMRIYIYLHKHMFPPIQSTNFLSICNHLLSFVIFYHIGICVGHIMIVFFTNVLIKYILLINISNLVNIFKIF